MQYIYSVKLISTAEAATKKRTSLQVVLGAVRRGDLDAVKVGATHLVKANKKFERWQLSKRHVKAARTRWKKKSNKSRKRKG